MPEAIPSGISIQTSRMITAFTEASFEPLVGDTRFSEFNAGQSDHFAGVYTFQRTRPGDTARIMSWIRRLKRTGTFWAFDPDRRIPLNGVVAGLQYDSHTGDVVTISGGDPSATILSDGDYIQIDTQFFMLLGDLTTNGSGVGTVQVWPTPRSGLTATDAVVTDNPVMEARITSPPPQESGSDKVSQISIAWRQA